MKFSPAQLKTLNYKQLAIDHGEKAVLALIGLFALLFLIRAPWKTETRTPEQLSTLADEGQRKVRAGTWPETEMKKYSTADTIGERVRQMLTPVNLTRFIPSTDTIWPLVKRQEPIREPEWYAVEDLVVRPGQVVIVTAPKSTGMELAGMDAKAGNANAAAGDDSGLGVKKDKAPGVGGGLPGGLPGAPAMAVGDPKAGGRAGGLPGAMPYGAEAAAGGVSQESGKGFRFVSVLGIVPLKKQAEKIARARNESFSKAMDEVQYLDFQLERKTAVDGPDPWSGPWEVVDLKAAEDVLEQAASYELDKLDDTVADPVFTMALPERAAGSWDKWATHPRVKDFELTEEGMELSRQVTEKLLELDEKLKLEQEKMGPQKGGLAGFKRDVRGIRRNLARAGEKNVRTVVDDISMGYGANAASNKVLQDQIRQKVVTASGTLLLFRFFDFDVAAGNAYRYRVRLVLQNPSAGLTADQVVAPFVAEGAKRETPWSAESAPAVVGENVKYYLSRVDAPRNKGVPAATFSLFQWNETTGMPVHDDKTRAILGQRIGSPTKTKIIAPPVSVKDGTFAFNTGDFLIDAIDEHPLDEREFASFHTDLKLPAESKNKPAFSDKAVVVNSFGELVPMDSLSRKGSEERNERRFDSLLQEWEKELGDSKDGTKVGSRADILAAAEGYAADKDTKKKGKKSKADPTRMQAMPGGNADPGGPTKNRGRGKPSGK